PNTIRCRTARPARSSSSSAACAAFCARNRAFSSRSSAASRAISWFAASAAASSSRRDASASSGTGTTPAATVTQHSKHPQQPQTMHHTPACRTRRYQPAAHATSEYLRLERARKARNQEFAVVIQDPSLTAEIVVTGYEPAEALEQLVDLIEN